MLTLLPKPRPLVSFGQPGVDFDGAVMGQMKTILRLPVADRGVILPDAHIAATMPVGGAASLNMAVCPSLIGHDIGCRVSITLFDGMPPEALRAHQPEMMRILRDATRFGRIKSGNSGRFIEHPVMNDPLWNDLTILRKLRNTAEEQLGTSGGGNHFANLMVGKVSRRADWLPLKPGTSFVGLMTHSGSRDAGYQAATHFMAQAQKENRAVARKVPAWLAWIPAENESALAYMSTIQLLDRYASANHKLIHNAVAAQIGVAPLLNIEAPHNFIWPSANGQYVHRKGSIPAHKGLPGIIAGSAASPSFLVTGLGNPESLESASHGAGRRFSRKQAKAAYDPTSVEKTYADLGITAHGVSKDENPYAYKDIHQVIGLQDGKLIDTVATMQPIVVVMSGE